MKIDITKPVRTRDGRPVTIISDKGRGNHPLVGYIGGDDTLRTWTASGRKFYATAESPHDLVQEMELWVNVYSNGGAGTFPTKEAAMLTRSIPIARVRVPYTPGQFD